MHTHLLALACHVAVTTFAADAPKLPSIPEQPIAKKTKLLFADDFEKAELGSAWKIVAPTFSIENVALKGTQMRFDAPAVEAAGGREGEACNEGASGGDRVGRADEGQRDRVPVPTRGRAVGQGGV